MQWWIDQARELFETGRSGFGWLILGLAASAMQRWYTFRQVKAERNQALAEVDKALNLQLKSCELLIKQSELKRLNGHGGDGAV